MRPSDMRISMKTDDGSLWHRTGSGDADAFGQLFERHADAIYNYCFRRTGNWAIAEDLLSIVFLEAWRRRDKRLAADKVLPWLYGIATNVIRNQWRSRRRYEAALARLSTERRSLVSTPVEDLADEQQTETIQSMLAELPRQQQEVFVLCTWFGLTYIEAAYALRVPVGTVRSRLSRANSRLRELMDGNGHREQEQHKPIEKVGR